MEQEKEVRNSSRLAARAAVSMLAAGLAISTPMNSSTAYRRAPSEVYVSEKDLAALQKAQDKRDRRAAKRRGEKV